MIRGLSKIHSAFLQWMFTEPHLCTMHCTRHCREPTGQKCIPSRELHSRRKISVKKIYDRIHVLNTVEENPSGKEDTEG